MAMCEKLNDNPAEAKNIYELITTEDPLNADAHNSFGNFLKETGEVEEAISHYERAIELEPTNPAPVNNLGILYRDDGQDDKAEEVFELAREKFREAKKVH